MSAVSAAALPQTMNIQGRLSDASGTPVASADYNINFTIYSTDSGGTELWSESRTVSVSNGFYDIVLGTVTPIALPFEDQYYLGIKVGSDSEMTPRVKLTAVPYSFISYNISCTDCIGPGQISDDYVFNTGDNMT